MSSTRFLCTGNSCNQSQDKETEPDGRQKKSPEHYSGCFGCKKECPKNWHTLGVWKSPQELGQANEDVAVVVPEGRTPGMVHQQQKQLKSGTNKSGMKEKGYNSTPTHTGVLGPSHSSGQPHQERQTTRGNKRELLLLARRQMGDRAGQPKDHSQPKN